MSYKPSEDEYYRQIKIASRRRFRRNSGLLSAAFLVLILILAFIGSSQILLVSILYLSILLEGICLAMFVANFDASWDLESLASIIVGKKRPVEETPRGRDVAASMNVFVKYAAQGSDYSRREVAMMLKNLLEKSGLIEGAKDDNQPTRLEGDLKRVVYNYTETENNPKNPRSLMLIGKKTSRREREAYLDSLDRIIKYIESI